jgi:hypothetical protein
MEDLYELLYFWRLIIAYLTLLGVQFILLGIAVGGWEMAHRKREQRALQRNL